MRWAADRFVPGYGTAAAITLGLATVVMTFAAEFFSHVISAGFAFAAFCLLMKETGRARQPRAGGGRRPARRARRHLRVPDRAWSASSCFGYALSRRRPTGSADAPPLYGAGAVVGALPMLAFNYWAFGNPLKLAYGVRRRLPRAQPATTCSA